MLDKTEKIKELIQKGFDLELLAFELDIPIEHLKDIKKSQEKRETTKKRLTSEKYDEEIVKKISDIDPPKTTWTMLANASDEEIEEALKVLENSDDKKQINSELVYQSMLEIAGPTVEQKLNNLNATDIKNIRIKGEQYQKLNPREVKFLKSLAPRKVKGVDLSEKQLNWLKSIVQHLIEENVISKNSMDDDQEFCDKILDCFGE